MTPITSDMIKRAARVLHSHYGIKRSYVTQADSDLAMHMLVEALHNVECKDMGEVIERVFRSKGYVLGNEGPNPL